MTIGLTRGQFFLIDRWPGEVTNGPNPATWTGLSATEDFPLGTKRMIYDDTNKGWSTMMYLYYVKGTAALAVAGALCGIDITSMATAGQWGYVCNDGGEVVKTGPLAVALATQVEATPYGWWWVGGVCPSDTITAFTSTFKFITDGSVTAGLGMVMADSSTAGYTKFHLATATDIGSISAFSLAADTTS